MNLIDFVDDVVVEVPQVLEPTAMTYVVRAARQFCRDSRIWQRDFSIYTVAGVEGIQLSPVEMGAAMDIEWLSLDGKYLDGRHSTALTGDGRPEERRGRPQIYHIFDGDRVVFSPTPDAQYKVKGVQSLLPERGADEIPDWMADQWGDTIIAAASANLLMMPEKDWTNPAAARAHAERYVRGMEAARKFAMGESRRATRIVAYGGL